MHADSHPPREKPPDSQAVSQNSAAIVFVEVDIVLGEPVIRTAPEGAINEPAATGVIAPEFLERR